MSSWLLRNPTVVALSRGDTFVFLPHDDAPFEISGVDVDIVAELLDATTKAPVLAADVSDVFGEDAVSLLCERRVLLLGEQDKLAAVIGQRPVGARKLCKRAVVGLTGAVGSFEMIHDILEIAGRVAEHVDVVLTDAAQRFVPLRLLEYQGMKVWTDAFDPEQGATVPHMHLATKADVVLIAPASAATLQRLASGACSDLLSLLVAATHAPVVVAPAMNERMWTNPAVARNAAQLRADGVWVVEPGPGWEVADPTQPTMLGGRGFGTQSVARLLACVLERAAEDRAAEAAESGGA
jgi:phosphopantothenoylcysteine decarboxylase/phosphopantothenate--cysteine ligase